jgi:hypothetical protein
MINWQYLSKLLAEKASTMNRKGVSQVEKMDSKHEAKVERWRTNLLSLFQSRQNIICSDLFIHYTGEVQQN